MTMSSSISSINNELIQSLSVMSKNNFLFAVIYKSKSLATFVIWEFRIIYNSDPLMTAKEPSKEATLQSSWVEVGAHQSISWDIVLYNEHLDFQSKIPLNPLLLEIHVCLDLIKSVFVLKTSKDSRHL